MFYLFMTLSSRVSKTGKSYYCSHAIWNHTWWKIYQHSGTSYKRILQNYLIFGSMIHDKLRRKKSLSRMRYGVHVKIHLCNNDHPIYCGRNLWNQNPQIIKRCIFPLRGVTERTFNLSENTTHTNFFPTSKTVIAVLYLQEIIFGNEPFTFIFY